jgi:opacity protein-like surface antigen
MHFVPLTAVSFPFGDASAARGDALSARYGWQWMPFEVGLGAKILDEIYLGAYLNFGVGSEGSDIKTEGRCEAGDDVSDDVSCSALSVHAGIEARYTFTPADSMSGWVGYGIGFTSASQSISDAGRYDETSTAQGIDFARISGGLDFRLKRGFGMGPFAIVSVGRYTHERTTIRNVVTFSGDIDDPATHAWISLGLRLVIFP